MEDFVFLFAISNNLSAQTNLWNQESGRVQQQIWAGEAPDFRLAETASERKNSREQIYRVKDGNGSGQKALACVRIKHFSDGTVGWMPKAPQECPLSVAG
ncbi:MAG: hypothetical protein HQM08_28925 [Candidatus Riflebacteria bacterium]|nr:hypothetical protein [Candidatus Riflebacteria bacterium]